MAQALPEASAVDSLGLHVLIVDDDDDWRAIAADVLTGAGFFVTTATDGRAGLASWRRTCAQVVITDVDMPVMNGRLLLAALHEIDRNVPVIVLTGEDISDAPTRFPGAFRVIQKPAPVEVLVLAVSEALLRRRVPRARRIVDAARTAVAAGRVRGDAFMSRIARAVRPRRDSNQPVPARTRRRPRNALAMAAGFGAAAAIAVLIAVTRGSSI
jgi:two-component system C4-dicarboxylate transport response regulator DctD